MSERLLFRWRAALMSKSGPAPTTRHVLLTLSTHGDEDGREIFPSTRTLAIETGLSRRTVEGRLREAVAVGWLARTPAGEGKAWKRSRYLLAFPAVVEQELPHDAVRGGAGASPPSRQQVEQELPHDSTIGGETDALGGEADDHMVGKELPLTSSLTSSLTSPDTSIRDKSRESEKSAQRFPPWSKLPRGGRQRVYPPEFEGAFAAMPRRHVPHPKAAAYKAWRARVPDVAEPFQLEAAADCYREDAERQGKIGTEFIMMAETFFGPGERYVPYLGREPGSLHAPAGGGHATAEQEEAAHRKSLERDRRLSDPEARPQDQHLHHAQLSRELAEAKQALAAAGDDATDRINQRLQDERSRAFPGREPPTGFLESTFIQIMRQELGPLPSDRRRGGETAPRPHARRVRVAS